MKGVKSIIQVLLNVAIVIALSFGLYHFIFNVWLDSYTNHNEFVEVPDLSKMNITDATAKLEELGLTYEVDSSRFDPNTKPFAIMDFYPAAESRVKEGRRIFIKSNPKTYRPVELPDLIGKSKRLAFTQLEISGLKIGKIIYEPDLAKDAVLKILYNGKIVKAGEQLPRFATVDLVLGRGMLSGVRMPNLVNLTLTEAKKSIKDNFFEIGQIKFIGASHDTINARVVYQFPFATDTYDQGQPIDIWLSTEPRDKIRTQLKELDIQYKNFGEDTISGSQYKDIITQKAEEQIKDLQNQQQQNNQPTEQQKPTEAPKAPEEVIIE
ncbi:PASTA domain-containing protein [Empedobacter falsenii]|uniref:PASTA domain-containing protein n=1 Tax=Empedobacter TaxID=59734 RepID=UPI002578832A|nr:MULTISPECIES: PASTA domain-containing protein [Empedobacter]MDM1297895.1 PASTA domain-containing protein [Empedobacter falsenii]MDM1317477.1 PASTA domain-containing protein [Empedobacter falsenii]